MASDSGKPTDFSTMGSAFALFRDAHLCQGQFHSHQYVSQAFFNLEHALRRFTTGEDVRSAAL